MTDLDAKLAALTAQLAELHDTGLVGFSDDALALRFTEKHGDTLRYVATWSKWFQWTGQHWKEEETLLAFDHARVLCRHEAKGANEGGKGLASAKTVNAIVSLARTDRRHAATADQWDTNAWLLNTPSGTVDLKTGDVHPHAQGHYITKIAAAGPSAISCPLWMGFLETITAGDEQLIEFLQRISGYGLTGSTRDHAMFFCYGLGANGKSVFINTITGILADYHRAAPMEMLLASKNERHPTELAGLMGCRLVTAVETAQGRRWDEAKIKALTGGDSISARFMRGDYFDYAPAFKLFVTGNHKPSLNTVDEAMRRRLYLVPFTVTIPEDARDELLTEKLRAEWPGILQWMIDGCLEWQEHGLAAPAAVTEATKEYLASQDTVRNWMAECTTEDPQTEVLSSTLFGSWKEWCMVNGEFPGSNKVFSQRLTDQGLPSREAARGRLFRGHRLTG